MEADDYFKRGIQHYEDGDYGSAISDYTIESNPNYVSAWCNRRLVWREKEDFEKAIADLDEAIRIEPDTASSWFLPALGAPAKTSCFG